MTEQTKFLNFLKTEQVDFVDFRFSDMLGQWHHMSFPQNAVTEDVLDEGIYFDGSSIAGWRAIHESDMVMKPDLSKYTLDPFSAQKTAIVICDIYDPQSGNVYERDPRGIARKAEEHIKKSGMATTAFFGPEAEFFIFDNVRFGLQKLSSFYEIEADEFPSTNRRALEVSAHGHRPQPKGGYMPVGPLDSLHDLRAEMVTTMAEMGLEMEKHHHEVAPAQHELGFKFGTLLETADHLQIYKYVVRNVAHTYGKTATFMPKPIFGDNGSGMHVHQSLWHNNTPLFAGNGYSGLSETALYYIGGILKHAKALNAFTNPTTNSYKRLVPGYEAPVILAYSAQNRSAACRIPSAKGEKAKRVEVRFPDPLANPYLGFSAMLMAGLDGIRNKIHPGEPVDHNLFEEVEIARTLPTVCGSLGEALKALQEDYQFLLEGDVFTKDFINTYLTYKWEEVHTYNMAPHPIEFQKLYSL
ncbi:type I glutamate--ammonia ligase [Candidatus Paracaedibacter symbiosus]|uniref:type I glutamate--ammonia ligase n=1 Tax=Candidatus Paracaedibacter symbiosus TaxID=244582 RepID=UPI0005096F0E|nr:type I glutamate--ammonia ligase [Candidatus Paracaedibacter symbiosus]